MNAPWLQEFRQPSSAYRGKPFWAWNGPLEEQELRRQIRVMHRMGLGGFFMHSRVGLATAYLSDEWFRCVDACIDEARKLKMEAWLYDEDRWPSGAAGGLVTRGPEYRQRSVVAEFIARPRDLKWDDALVAAFVVRVSETTVREYRRVAQGQVPAALAPGESLLAFRVRISGDSDWYNGAAYLDTLNPAAVRDFLRVTHEQYRKRCGKHFGKAIPGIFTDEPNHAARLAGGKDRPLSLPWTARLPGVFRRRYGYDLLNRLPELCFDLAGQAVSRARYHYHDCVTHLFVDAFARQIGAWCGKHGIAFTGHVLSEETLSSQTCVVGSCMRFYEHMQAPGMDLLTEHNREYDTAKQVSSAARQFGRKWRLTETYGCTGWDFAFAGHKALGDWQVALGINLRAPHLSWYTMLAEAKRDYPAGIFFQSPWWEAYPKVEDYFGRLHAMMTRGVEVRDLLVIHPVESTWLLVRKDWRAQAEVKQLDRMIVELRDSLLAENLDFDYGDEELLSRRARVEEEDGAAVLVVGRARYKAVLVPPVLTLRGTTLALLEKFRAAGGRVVFSGKVARCVDAVPSRAAVRFARGGPRAPAQGPPLAAAVADACRRVSIADPQGREIAPALYLLREDADAFYLFICNTGLSPRQFEPSPWNEAMVRDRRAAFPDVTVSGFAGCAGPPLELDPDTGAVTAAQARETARGWRIQTSLPPLGSRLFVISKRKQGAAPERKALRHVRAQTLGGKVWDIALSECNNLVLDRPRFRIGAGAWKGPEEILRVDKLAREALGMRPRGGGMKQPWAREKPAHPKRIPVTLRYSFKVKAVPSGDLFLGVEEPAHFQVAVNGVPLSMDAECGWWTDPSLRRIPLAPSLLRPGANEITLQCDYDENFPGLEIAYLLGNFGVAVRDTEISMTAPPAVLKLGDWVKQGLAFYSGSVSYRRTIRPRLRKGQRLFVEVPEYRGVGVRVTVNGKCAGVIGWEPNEVDITDGLGDGSAMLTAGGPVELGLEVLGHRRNSHGPLHLAQKWPHWTGPGEFLSSGPNWMDGYNLVPCGLLAAPRLVVRR